MALVQPTLKTNLLTLFNQMKQSEMSEEQYADNLSTIITNYIKTATVTVQSGQAVATPSGPGSTSEHGTGSLS